MNDEPLSQMGPQPAARSGTARARALGTLALALVLVTPALLVLRISQPAPASPREGPPLLLDPAAVSEQLALDDAAAARAPSGEGPDERRRLYRELNVAEQEGRDPPGRAHQRREALRAAVDRLLDEHGEAVLAAVRAADLRGLDAALRGDLPAGERVAETGGFVRMMERYDLVRDGRQVAPRFVVRTLFKARWNAIHGRDLTEGLSAIEQQAYWGWLGFGAVSAPAERRLEALDRHAEAGGTHAEEARALVLYDEGRMADARDAFRAAHDARPSFRLRNHALACDEP